MGVFLEELILNALDLRSVGINEFAWRYENVLEVIESLCDNNCIILGGDVYKIEDKDSFVSSTGDSWYYNKGDSENDGVESCKKATEYIENY